MSDALTIARDLLRCPSVTPADAGALGVLETVLKAAGFETHRVTFSEPGAADIDNLYARIGNGKPHITFAGHTDVVPPGDEAKWTHGAFAICEFFPSLSSTFVFFLMNAILFTSF